MNNIWGHYDLKAWTFDDLTALCAVWFTLSVLRDLFLKPWVDQYLLTFKVNVKVKLESFNCCLQQKHSSYYSFLPDGRDRNRKSPKPHHFQPPNSTHMWTLIRQCAVRVLVLIWITVLDLEPNPDFQTFLIISETYHQIFKCNTSKRRSGQELLFIFFELRAATCLWGRYDPKTENFTYFYIYLLHIKFVSKTFYIPVKSYPMATFHVLVAKVYIVTGAHYVT